ncbi:4395_t:CDS:2, partial [Gigaspora margarita]
EHSSFTKALIDKAYPLSLENTNTNDNYTIEAQPFFDFKNKNVIDSHEKKNIRETVYIEYKRSPKQKYGLGMGYAKKALDYTIRADNFIERMKAEIDEESIKNVIISDPIHIKHKGHQSKCYRLEGSSNAKSVRHCQKCRQLDHYAPHCPN